MAYARIGDLAMKYVSAIILSTCLFGGAFAAAPNPQLDLTYNYVDMYGEQSIYNNESEFWTPSSNQLYVYNAKSLNRSTNFHRIPQIPYNVKIMLKPANPK